jgi:hypothetical protein|tara:strand:+ start:1122 stop:1517 length:396 start_codon:yes stop_codon:yes gene_type:complete
MALPIGNIIKELFSGGVTDLVDEVVTSKEEAQELKIRLTEVENKLTETIEQEVSKRWVADMQSDSYLSKNIRPMVLAFLVVSTIVMVFIDSGKLDFEVKDTWVDLLQIVLITVIGAYFGSRGLEKVKGGKQ